MKVPSKANSIRERGQGKRRQKSGRLVIAISVVDAELTWSIDILSTRNLQGWKYKRVVLIWACVHQSAYSTESKWNAKKLEWNLEWNL